MEKPTKNPTTESIKEGGRLSIIGAVILLGYTIVDLFSEMEMGSMWARVLLIALVIALRMVEKYQHTNGGIDIGF